MSITKNIGGRPKIILSLKQVQEVETLAGVLSKQQLAAYFGISENTLTEVAKRQPEVFEAYRKGEDKTTARVASALMEAVDQGDMRAIQFYLKTQAGWTEKQFFEVSHARQAGEPEDAHWGIDALGEREENEVPTEITVVYEYTNVDGTRVRDKKSATKSER